MNILYYSVHAVLEYDEIQLLKSLGHNVCCLGNSSRYSQLQDFRCSLVWNETEQYFYEAFEQYGGKFSFAGDISDFFIPQEFVLLFDCTIVMHDIFFVGKFWNALSQRPIFWRTIGQGMQEYELIAAPYRAAGLSIIRYSPTENLIPEYLGGDAIIRFCKSPDYYADWSGEHPSILTFSNLYKQRYPEEYSDYLSIIEDLPARLGGYGNDDCRSAIGVLTQQDQLTAYRNARAYLYASGLGIPYTLNFIEAWMTGAPMVVYAPKDRVGTYFEIDKLIEHGVNGFICRTITDARNTLNQLINDEALAMRISAAGRARATELFSDQSAAPLWEVVLRDGLSQRLSTGNTTNIKDTNASLEVDTNMIEAQPL